MTIKTSPYIPSFLKAALQDSRPLQLTFSEISDTNIKSTSSFIYDPLGAPLKSTQQLNTDWSTFQNHVFFSSAEAKANLAFDQIINGYPFDGTKSEVEAFFEKLTGFDRWVFDQFPRYRGQLLFSGTVVGEDTDGTKGTWIKVKDAAGALYPEISKNKTGESILNPKDDASLTIEAQVFVPSIATVGTQVLFQKLSGSAAGFSMYIVPTISTTTCEARFSVVSGSNAITTSTLLTKGAFNHITVTLNRELGVHFLQFFLDSQQVDASQSKYAIGELGIDASDFVIGSGTLLSLGTTTVLPTQTFSGSIDEFRVFHSTRSALQQQLFARKAIYATPELKLYYRFNEPASISTNATDSVNSIVLDSSGNSLHALINAFTTSLRQNAATDSLNPMIYELPETTTVLFPAYAPVIALNTDLLSSATLYDQANPNLITKLIPQHYLLEGAVQDGFKEPEGNAGQLYAGNGIPGQGQMGSTQIILSFLYIWARFFDEMKLYLDAFSSLRYVDYDKTDTIPDNFLYDLVKQYGFHLPPMFNNSSIDQYINAENIGQDIATNVFSLKHVQNELLRRVLINIHDVLKSKGTQHSIKSFLRAVGIDPENSMRIREFGGPTTRQLSFSRETKREPNVMLEFQTSSLAISPYLSSSRVEPGVPTIAGTFVQQLQYPPNGISNNSSDGLITSGSWTVETIVKYTPVNIRAMTNVTQSLVRLCTTGSMSGTTGLVANLLAVSSSISPKLLLYIRPGNTGSSPILSMSLDMLAPGLFDGSRWNVSFGCERNDSIGSVVSSSYFLRLASENDGRVTFFKTTSSFFLETSGQAGELNVFRHLDSTGNASGTFIVAGQNQSINSGAGTGFLFLNNSFTAPGGSRLTTFNGWLSNLRVWSKALTTTEWREHVRNYKSLGVEDPLVNYNFVKTRSGSFERVRLDTFTKQPIRLANGTASLGPLGSISFLDFSLNLNHVAGTGFPIDKNCLVGEIFDYSYLSPNFDEASTNEKIRVRSFQNQDLIDETPWASAAPVYELVKSEQPTDDTRLSIEFSLVDALNRDIVTLFSTFDAIDNAIGSPELLFSPDYPDLYRLRQVYFNRISEKLNFKDFFEFFKWFDMSIGTFIEQLVPRKTRFKGTNFVIESHMLERHKMEYAVSEAYLSESERNRITDVLLLQQIVGVLRKY